MEEPSQCDRKTTACAAAEAGVCCGNRAELLGCSSSFVCVNTDKPVSDEGGRTHQPADFLGSSIFNQMPVVEVRNLLSILKH